MKTRFALVVAIILLVVVSSAFVVVTYRPSLTGTESTTGATTNRTVLSLIRTITVPNVSGRIDHMDIDLEGHRLFVAALGNDSVFVVDLALGKLIRSITGFDEPQGILYVPGSHALFVSNGGNGTVEIFDSSRFSLLRSISFSADADNMRYDSIVKLVYVSFGVGYGAGVGVIDATNFQLIGTIQFGNHPESFQVEQNGTRIFANVPTLGLIMVANKTTGRLTTSWSPSNATANFPMALDERGGRLFVGTWSPPSLLVFDSKLGRLISSVSICGDADDIYYDSARGLAYVSCGQGFLDVVGQTSANSYAVVSELSTRNGARTSLFVPSLNELLVAAPASGAPAAILVLESVPTTPQA